MRVAQEGTSTKPKRRALLWVAAAALLVWLLLTNLRFEVSHYSVESRRLPAPLDGLVIAQVSDLHNRDWGSGLTDQLRKAQPDLIVFTGDLIDFRRGGLGAALRLAQEAAAIAPVYYVSGNHEARSRDFPLLLTGLKEAGVRLLDERQQVFEKAGGALTLLGLSDPAFLGEITKAQEEEKTRQSLSSLLPEEGGFTLLLSHRPEFFPLYAAHGIDLALCGHAHGGQVRLPLLGPLLAPGQGFFPPYAQGLIQQGDSAMVVSRGLGNSVMPVRVNNTPELVIVTLKRAE